MSAIRQHLPVAAALGVMVLIEVVSLGHGTIGTVLVIAACVLAAAAVVLRLDVDRAAIWSAYLAAFTISWNGWYVGPERPGDLLLLVGLMLFAFTYRDGVWPRLPGWIYQLAVVIILLVAIHVAVPDSATYLSHRTVLTGKGQPTVSTTVSIWAANLGVGFKFLVAVAAIPIMCVFAGQRDRRNVPRLALAFALGCAVSGWVAASERFGVPSLDKFLLGISVPGATRQIGLSYHPNYLAASLVVTAPLGIWLATQPDRRSRLLGWFTMLGCALGVYASGSRGGTVCTVLAFVLGVLLIPPARRYAPQVFGLLVAAGLLLFVAAPSLAHRILVSTRLIGGISTSGSDQARSLLSQQGWRDFHHSPWVGIGLQVAAEAQNVYLQALASGGVLLCASLLVYLAFAAMISFQLIRRSPLAGALCAATLSAMALNIIEADLTDRFYYIPIALIVALAAVLGDPSVTEDDLRPFAPAATPNVEAPAPVRT